MSDEMHYRYDSKLGQYVECSAEEAWDREDNGGSMELGPTYIPPNKRLLTDAGTRFEHISDLLEYLNDGLVAVNFSLSRYTSANDDQRKVKLEGAIALVNVYRDQLANLDGNKWNLNSLLDKCVPEKGVLEGIRRERIEALKPAPKTLQQLPIEDDPNLQGI
jgi:hypothetical protein